MTDDLTLPEVNPGDLVLVQHKRHGSNYPPYLFVSDGRIAPLDDTGYPGDVEEEVQGVKSS